MADAPRVARCPQAIYLTRRGRLEEARSVLKSFLYFLYDDKGARDSSPVHSPHTPEGWSATRPWTRPTGALKLLAASYTDAPAKAGDYQGVGVADGAVDTGETSSDALPRRGTRRRVPATCHPL